MLILNRRPKESITIMVGDTEITVTVTKILTRTQVKLGIDAPDDVKILRSELEDIDE